MKTLLLRIGFAIIFAFFLFFLFSAYQYYQALHSDDPIVPYVIVESGQTTVVRGDLAIDMVTQDRYDLKENDIIITKANTLAIVHWPDHSETRLGSETRMKIARMQASQDYSSIEIEFTLEEGKAWSTVVRTMYPGSFFRTNTPQGAVAGVRGTIYDIDLVGGYIHSVDHNVSVTDRAGNSVNILPGEIVSVKNILVKLSQEALDSTWTALNTLRDREFLNLRQSDIQKRIDTLAGSSSNLWDRFVRWILSFFPSFDDLAAMSYFVGNISGIDQMQIPQEQLLRLYQNFQDTKFVQERDAIRAYIEQQSQNLKLSPELLQTFTRSAVWDAISFSGMTLSGTDAFLEKAKTEFDTQVRSVLDVVRFQELNEKAKETLRNLVQ